MHTPFPVLLAYIDASSATLVLNLIFAGLVSGALFFRRALSTVRGWFGGSPPPAASDSGTDSSSPTP